MTWQSEAVSLTAFIVSLVNMVALTDGVFYQYHVFWVKMPEVS
jgi:hypothetical protein